ncbi:DUF5610 domain-containing protein [Burkholderia sp. LMU1-1-1.1]|uniref:DUF5610 domain-containing protein n=1 Tax=Burkholderia sp. LMU1-1-1.1 TaxID=3135266 RepID=UPI00342A602C
MANPVSVTSGNTAASKAAPLQAKDVQAKDDSTMSVGAKAKAQLNASIVQASLTVSLNSSNEPMSVVLKTALTGINEALKDQFGDNAIENAVSQDNTPEGTASRIVSLSTAFYDAFKQQHPGEDEEVLLNKFIDTLKKGVDQGFGEARDVLEGLKVLGGEVASNIDKTYELVQKGFEDFIASRLAKPAETLPKTDKEAPANR